MALAVAKSRGLSGIPASLPLLVDATPRAFLSWGSTLLHGHYSTSPPPYYRELLSWDFLSPTAHQASEIHGCRSCPLQHPDSFSESEFRRHFPVAGYGVALRLFRPLGDFFSPLPSHHFQAGNAHGVLPFRGFPSHAAPYGSSPPVCPLDVAPLVSRLRPKRKLPWARAAP